MAGDGPSGFWSYAHDDESQSRGRLLRLAERIRDEYSLITGEDLELFVDRDSLAWGDAWRIRISEAIQETTFFIPVISPRYFKRDECRKELLKFATNARSVGASDLLLPILYVNVRDLNEDNPDEAVALVAGTQYADWRDLRLADEDSSEYARAVNDLAQRLADIAETYESTPSVTPVIAGASDDPEDDEPGMIDLIAQVEEILPQWFALLERLPRTMSRMTVPIDHASERFTTEGKDSFVKRVVIAREMAAEIGPDALEIKEIGEEYASTLLDIDPGVRAVIQMVDDQDLGDEDRQSACEMFQALREMIDSSREMERALSGLIEAMAGTSRQFRDLRPPLDNIRSGARSMIDGQTIFEEWLRLMDSSRLDCRDFIPSDT